MTNNPFESPVDAQVYPQEESKTLSPNQVAYNVITDTVTGVNARWSDNRFQAIFVLISILIASLIGAMLVAINSQWKLPWYAGALFGSFAGLLIGVFGSGVYLMFYRAIRHIKGKHD